LAAVEEAVVLYRELAAANPMAFQSELATALNNLSSQLGNLGRQEEATRAAEEAEQIIRGLLDRQ
jgi:hypothetical protein